MSGGREMTSEFRVSDLGGFLGECAWSHFWVSQFRGCACGVVAGGSRFSEVYGSGWERYFLVRSSASSRSPRDLSYELNCFILTRDLPSLWP